MEKKRGKTAEKKKKESSQRKAIGTKYHNGFSVKKNRLFPFL